MAAEQTQNTALRYHRFGAPEEVLSCEQSVLSPRPDAQLRVRMLLAPINPSDLIPITGAYSHLIKPPLTAGYEGVGEVIEAPEGAEHLLGTRVLPLRGEGTWQHFVDCDAAIAVPVPDGITDDVAARAYINPMSAQQLLRLWPVRDKHIILTGAGSYIAAILAQWALDEGAKSVAGIYRSEVQQARIEALGVEPIHDSQETRIQALAQRADITFDAVGGVLGSAILQSMQRGTEFVGYGLLSGQPVFPTASTQAQMRRFHLRDCLKDMSSAEWQAQFTHLWPRLQATRLPAVDRYNLDDWKACLAAFAKPGRARKPMLLLR